jgi:hypothetical protein
MGGEIQCFMLIRNNYLDDEWKKHTSEDRSLEALTLDE